MEYNITYTNSQDRQAKIATQQGLNHRMLTDTFDKGADPANPKGTMVFTDTPDTPEVTPDYKAQFAAAASVPDQIAVIAKMLGLQ